ncbi:hypothetical protein BTVI_03143 [Pitangus sulphuratus]|nr:hypothetical protein BTVI_03143 [Pitangus sulphuratus]
MSGIVKLRLTVKTKIRIRFQNSDKQWDNTPKLEELNSSGIPQFVPCSISYNELHLKCSYTNALRMRNEQEDLKALVLSKRFDITDIGETWWDESCDWCAILDDYRLFRRDRQGRWGRVMLYIIEELECMDLTDENVTNKVGVIVGIY